MHMQRPYPIPEVAEARVGQILHYHACHCSQPSCRGWLALLQNRFGGPAGVEKEVHEGGENDGGFEFSCRYRT